MTYKKITNPLDSVVSVNYLGNVYELGPNGSGVFDETVAGHWAGIHEFLLVEDATEDTEVEEKPKKSKTK